MVEKIEIINPLQYKNWDNLILTADDYSFFQSSAWARVLNETYGYEPVYFIVVENDTLSFLLPLMEISSFLTGRRGVSLPFTDYSFPMIKNGLNVNTTFSHIKEIAQNRNWKTLEIRGQSRLLQEEKFFSYYYNHTLNLSEDKDHLINQLSKSTKRSLRKAEEENIKIEISSDIESVKDYFHLHCLTRKRHGLPPQPYAFFQNIYTRIIQQGLGISVIARLNGMAIAGAMFFHKGKKALYKYGASDMKYQILRPNNLIMWEAIKYFGSKGFESLCFGRTDQDQEGLRRFKKGWGCEESEIYYYKYNFVTNSFKSPTEGVSSMTKRVFSMMPISASRLIGKILYKHVG